MLQRIATHRRLHLLFVPILLAGCTRGEAAVEAGQAGGEVPELVIRVNAAASAGAVPVTVEEFAGRILAGTRTVRGTETHVTPVTFVVPGGVDSFRLTLAGADATARLDVEVEGGRPHTRLHAQGAAVLIARDPGARVSIHSGSRDAVLQRR